MPNPQFTIEAPTPPQFTIEPPARPTPESGAWAGIKRGVSGIVHTPGQILDALTSPPQDENETKMSTLGGPGALLIHRLIAEPMAQQHDLAEKYQKEATGSAVAPKEKFGFDFSLTGSTPQEKAQHLANLHRIASVVPGVGPLVAGLTERFLGIGEHEGQPDKSGALAEGATYIAAPKAAEEVIKALPAATKAVAPPVTRTAIKVANKALSPSTVGAAAGGAVAGPAGAAGGAALLPEVFPGWAERAKEGVIPTPEWAAKPTPQMELYKNTPKLGNSPIQPAFSPTPFRETPSEATPAQPMATPAEAIKAAAKPTPFQEAPAPTFTLATKGGTPVNDVLMKVDPAKLDAAWPKDSYYIRHGGVSKSSSLAAYQRAQGDVLGNQPITAPRITIDAKGNVDFIDGRNHFAALRDQGIEEVQVSVPPDQVAAFEKHLGAVRAQPETPSSMEGYYGKNAGKSNNFGKTGKPTAQFKRDFPEGIVPPSAAPARPQPSWSFATDPTKLHGYKGKLGEMK